MKYYGVNLKGDLTRRTDFELIAPLIGEANKSYIQSLLDYREANGTRYYHSNVVDNVQGDVVTGVNEFFPGVPPSDKQIDIVSLKGLVDGGNYWVNRTDILESISGPSGIALTTNEGLAAFGHNGSYSVNSESYSNSENTWSYRTDGNVQRLGATPFSLTSELHSH